MAAFVPTTAVLRTQQSTSSTDAPSRDELLSGVAARRIERARLVRLDTLQKQAAWLEELALLRDKSPVPDDTVAQQKSYMDRLAEYACHVSFAFSPDAAVPFVANRQQRAKEIQAYSEAASGNWNAQLDLLRTPPRPHEILVESMEITSTTKPAFETSAPAALTAAKTPVVPVEIPVEATVEVADVTSPPAVVETQPAPEAKVVVETIEPGETSSTMNSAVTKKKKSKQTVTPQPPADGGDSKSTLKSFGVGLLDAIVEGVKPMTDAVQPTFTAQVSEALSVEGKTGKKADKLIPQDLLELVTNGKVKDLTVTKLRRLLSSVGLKTSGRKSELIARLTSYVRS